MDYIVPPINSKGTFDLASPFNNLLSPLEEYTVTAIRSLNEINTDDPLNQIYIPAGLTQADLEQDMADNVPIVVLMSTAEEYLYVPANKILTIPKSNGIKHQEKILSIPLGILPLDMDLSVLISGIEDLVYNVSGSKSEASVIPSSAVVLLTEAETQRLRLLRENRQTVHKSYMIRYEETLELLNKKELYISGLEDYIKKVKGSENN